MSTGLYWIPVIEKKGNNLPTDLKFALRKRYDITIPVVFGADDLPYFQGLDDAGIKGAAEVISAIEKFSIIEVFEE